MKLKTPFLAAGLMLVSALGAHAQGTELLRDSYTAANSTYPTNVMGFPLGSGINSGINPPTTRLTGPLAPNLRYIQRDAAKTNSVYGINGNKLRVQESGSPGRVVLSANGSTPFDFAPALGIAGATAADPAIYEISISMDNDSDAGSGTSRGTQRMSFALGTTDGNNGTWDFGFQIYKTAYANTNYVMANRVDLGSTGNATDHTTVITNNAGVFGTEINVLMRVTDAGAEATTFNSRLQLSLDGGVTWFYDTQADTGNLPNGWRLDGSSRFLMWDIAPNATARYDNLVVRSVYAPAIPSVTWTGGGADDNWSTGGNWNGPVPTGGTALAFEGTSRQASLNDLVDMTTPWLTFRNGGFSFTGNLLDIGSAITNLAGVNTFGNELSFSSTGAKVWNIANGSEVVLNNTTSVEVGGDHEIYGGGTLRIKGAMNIGLATDANPAFVIGEGEILVDGGTYNSKGGYRIGAFPTGIGAKTVLTNGATFSLNLAAANLRVGDSVNPNASLLDINNSTLTMAGGSLGIPYAGGAVGAVKQVGGTVSGGLVVFNDAGAGNGTYTIKNGILEPIQIREDFVAGSSSIQFDNATLRTAGNANINFFSGVDVAEIQSGGLTIEGTVEVTIAQPLTGTGVLTKTGPAKVTLTGANSYSGNTVIQSGTLALPTIQTNATSVQVADGAGFGIRHVQPNSTLSVNALSFTGNSFGTLNIDLSTNSNQTLPLMRVSSLSVSGPVVVNVENGFLLSAGQMVLIDYNGAISGGFQFSLGNLPPGITASLVNNTANSSIDLLITAVPALRWTGANTGDWDTFTENWINLQNGTSSVFFNGFPTEFRDGAATGNITVNGSAFPSPSIVIVSNSTLPYVWTDGIITVGTVKKQGTGSLTRNGGEADSIAVVELNEGSYTFNNAFDLQFPTALADVDGGTGTFVKKGIATLTVTNSSSTYDGAIVVEEGTLKLGVAGALGSGNGQTTIANGATLDLNNQIAPGEPVIVSGAGVGGTGAIIDSTASGSVAHNLTDVTLVGDTIFGSPNGGRWDIRVRSASGVGPGLRGNGFNLTKVGSGSVSIACQRHFTVDQPYWEMNLGNVVISEGSVTFAESLTLGNPSKTITIGPGATLGTFDLNYTNPIVRNIFMTDASISSSGGANETNAFAGTIQITGTSHLRGLDAKLVMNGPIVGSGTVTVSGSGAGAVYLNGNNTFVGDTIVTNTTLGGSGVIPGNLIMLAGTNAPGMGVGTLTVNGNATLAGTTLMELDRSKTPNSDRLVVAGSVSWSGELRVVLGAGAPAPQAGDVYQLFNKAGSGGFSSVLLPDLSALPGGLAWDTSSLTVNGSIKVTGTAVPPTIGTVSMQGGNFVFSGTGGVEGSSYTVLSSLDVALPLANWTPVATNVFGAGGSFSYTNSVNPGTPATFFMLQVP